MMDGYASSLLRQDNRSRRYFSTETMGRSASGLVTWNPADVGSRITLSNSNLSAEKNTGDSYDNGGARAFGFRSTGKRYFEVYIDQGGTSPFIMLGVSTSSWNVSSTTALGGDAYSWAYSQQTGNKRNGGSSTAYGSSLATGDVLGVAVDFTAQKIWFSKNGAWQASGDPAAGTGEAFSNVAGAPIAPTVHLYRATSPRNKVTGRFKSSDFTYTPPAGYLGWGE